MGPKLECGGCSFEFEPTTEQRLDAMNFVTVYCPVCCPHVTVEQGMRDQMQGWRDRERLRSPFYRELPDGITATMDRVCAQLERILGRTLI